METISISKLPQLLRSNRTLLVDFKSNTCAPCRAILPVLRQLSSRVPVAQIDVEENVRYMMDAYNITSTPTVVLFQNGYEMTRLVGSFTLQKALRQFEPYI